MEEKNKTAAQLQGEPVAWVECSPAWLKAGGDCATAPRLCIGRDGISHLHPARAEQPAPVAVVFTERFKEVMSYLLGEDELDGHLFRDPHKDGMYWWRRELRACLDEVKRLNP